MIYWRCSWEIELINLNFFDRKQALAGKLDAEKEGIVVPLTLEDYCIKPKSKPSNQEMAVSELNWTDLSAIYFIYKIGLKFVSLTWPTSTMKTMI